MERKIQLLLPLKFGPGRIFLECIPREKIIRVWSTVRAKLRESLSEETFESVPLDRNKSSMLSTRTHYYSKLLENIARYPLVNLVYFMAHWMKIILSSDIISGFATPFEACYCDHLEGFIKFRIPAIEFPFAITELPGFRSESLHESWSRLSLRSLASLSNARQAHPGPRHLGKMKFCRQANAWSPFAMLLFNQAVLWHRQQTRLCCSKTQRENIKMTNYWASPSGEKD